jgi:hypothetical protein
MVLSVKASAIAEFPEFPMKMVLGPLPESQGRFNKSHVVYYRIRLRHQAGNRWRMDDFTMVTA